MAIVEAYTGTQAVDTNEHSMPNDAAGLGTPITVGGVYQLRLDVADMVAGDELQIRIYEKCRSGDTQRLAEQWNLVGVQSKPLFFAPPITLKHGWDMTLDAISGTITVHWSIFRIAGE